MRTLAFQSLWLATGYRALPGLRGPGVNGSDKLWTHPAEVVTEIPTNGGALDMGTVHYTYGDFIVRPRIARSPRGRTR
jgi:hypothetical protein